VHAIEKLAERDFESAAALLAEAFFLNPAHVYIFANETHRKKALPWSLQRNLAAQAPLEHSFCVAQESGNPPRRTIVAMGFWHAPGSASVSIRGLLRPGFLAVPIRCGLGAARRLLEITRCLADERRAALGSARAWYLNNMAVAAHLRGSGLGTELLAGELRSRIDPSGHAAALATQRPEGVRFYRRFGFEVVSDRTLGSGRRSFRNWIMLRQPKQVEVL
jgi:GNAT superfamily N-acetyltransferase